MAAVSSQPSRGDVWFVDLDPARGRERGRRRPCLVVSVDAFNRSPAQLAIVLLITTTARNIPVHVTIEPPEGGLRQRSFIKCEDIRSISTERLIEHWGTVSHPTLSEVADRMRILLDL